MIENRIVDKGTEMLNSTIYRVDVYIKGVHSLKGVRVGVIREVQRQEAWHWCWERVVGEILRGKR